jgi:hypothetical protein
MGSSVAFDTSNKENQDKFIEILNLKINELKLDPFKLVNFTQEEIQLFDKFGYKFYNSKYNITLEYLNSMLVSFNAIHFLNE